MSEWIAIEDNLPEFDQPVWFYPQGIIGCRCDCGDEGYLWGNSYGMFWRGKDNVWQCDGEVDDDYQPTHWMPLPRMVL